MNASDLAKKLLFETLIQNAIKKVILAVPFFGLPVVNPLFIFVAEKLYSYLYDELEQEGTLLMIGIRTENQKVKYEESVKELEAAINQGQTDEQINLAREEFKKRLKDLINLGVNK
jgi:predicted Zn-dependent peptidase